MKAPIRIAVIIPAASRDDIFDTLESVVLYTDPARLIFVIDDTSKPSINHARIRALSSDIVVMRPPSARSGARGGLWVKEAAAYRWILERFHPGILLRLDADALILRAGIESAAEEVFASQPHVGLLGSYRIASDGGVRDFSPAVHLLRLETGWRGLLHPKLRAGLQRQIRLAREHGYVDGENVLGAACIHSYQAANAIYERGWFNLPWIEPSGLGDDHIMSLLTVAAGYRLADFGGPMDPLALKWRGLPEHPAELLMKGKLVTHSVRSWNDLTEHEIRGIFAQARTRHVDGSAG